MFYNLFDNALHNGSEQPNPVHLTSQESNGYLALVCEDNGAGVLNEDKKRLFTQVFGKNTGLGLFLSREILSITDITITENGTTGKAPGLRSR
ncbi:MAG: ATP-binding protein [Methanoregula sp.]|nr:ATP-binding protein [Methanoregula sp.]